MRWLICGGRDFKDWGFFTMVLVNVCNQNGGLPKTVISGMARGADSLAVRWARGYGITVEVYPAKWDIYGKKAGFIRNTEMLIEGKPDLVIAFPGGKGTDMMVDIATKGGVKVLEYSPLST